MWGRCYVAVSYTHLASNAGAAHAVKKGDTLYSIAKKYGVSVADIVKANNIKNNHIEIGEKLVIPTKTVEKPTTVVKTAKKANVFGNGIVKDAPSLSNKEDVYKRQGYCYSLCPDSKCCIMF